MCTNTSDPEAVLLWQKLEKHDIFEELKAMSLWLEGREWANEP